MSILIYWGPPGSYKTYHAVKNSLDIIFKTERFFVTNVEGLSLKKVIDKFGSIYGLVTFSQKLSFFEKRRLSFFSLYFEELSPFDLNVLLKNIPLWIPYSSYVLLDECQLFYPSSFTQKDFDQNVDGGDEFPLVMSYRERFDAFSAEFIKRNLDSVKKQFSDIHSIPLEDANFQPVFLNYLDNKVSFRPSSLHEIYSLHRHYYFDFLFTCQSLKQISGSILKVSESAVLFKNMARFGFKSGKYRFYFHSAFSSPLKKDKGESAVVDRKVFECYKSTSIGTYSDTLASKNFFSSAVFRKVLFAFLFGVVAIVTAIIIFMNSSFFGTNHAVENKENKNEIINNFPTTHQNSELSSDSDISPSNSENFHSLANFESIKHDNSLKNSLKISLESVGDEVHPQDDFYHQKIYINGYKLVTSHSGARKYFFAASFVYEDGSISQFNEFPSPYIVVPISRCLYRQYRHQTFVRYIHCLPPNSLNRQKSKSLFPELVKVESE